MDRITSTLLAEFAREQALALPEDEAFEHFANYSVASSYISDTFSIDDLATGAGDDTGIDGIAVLVNGVLVTDADQVRRLRELNGYVEATFIFVQAKTGDNLNGAEFSSFIAGVKDFFSDAPMLRRNGEITAFAGLQQAVYTESAHFSRGRPACHVYYVYTGTWRGDENIEGRRRAGVQELEESNLFGPVTLEIIDAGNIQELYTQSKSKVKTDVVVDRKIVLPGMVGVEVAYLGILPAREYVRLISDGTRGINHGLFEENVRDFQDYNAVNREIQATLSGTEAERFLILNNGITMVARSLTTVGDRFHIEDYQIVNGCQTSYVLFDARDRLTDNVFVPIKLIVTTDEDIIAAVVQSTNRQNPIKIEDLSALSKFQKRLEQFFLSFDGRQALYYERRSKQYASSVEVEKVRVVPRSFQIRSFSSMFLNEPHRAVRYYGELVEGIGSRIFANDHSMWPYYTSAYAYYKLEFLFRNGLLNGEFRPGRYQVLMALRCAVAGIDMPALNSERRSEIYCRRVLDVLWDDEAARRAFQRAGEQVVAAAKSSGADPLHRDSYKTQALTEHVLAQYRA